MDPETLAKAIAQKQFQIEQLSVQLLENIHKIEELETSLKGLQSEKGELIRKLEKKSLAIKQENDDIELLKKKIKSFEKRTWADTFSGINSWIGHLPYKFMSKGENNIGLVHKHV